MENYFTGICESMCPRDEIKLRTEQKLLHFFERKFSKQNNYESDEAKVVKEFSRSAAGHKAPRSRDLRTPRALLKTVEYLLTDIVNDDRKPFNVVYDFIFDRLRAVRQEIVMQNLSEGITINLMEPMCMFLAFSLYSLIDQNMNIFDPKICRQHLQECLKKVLSCYDAFKEEEINNANREIIESIYLMFNLGDIDAIKRAFSLPNAIRKSDLYEQSLKISLTFCCKNYYKCLILLSRLPHLIGAMASVHVQTIRREILKSFSIAYQNKVFTVPNEWLMNILLYDSEQRLIAEMRYYGIQIDEEAHNVRFNKADFKFDIPTLKSKHEHFVSNHFSSAPSQYFMLQI